MIQASTDKLHSSLSNRWGASDDVPYSRARVGEIMNSKKCMSLQKKMARLINKDWILLCWFVDKDKRVFVTLEHQL